MKKPNNLFSGYARYSSIAIQMLVIIAGGSIGGFYLDKWVGLGFPVFTLVLSVLSVFIAIYIAVKDFLKK